MSKKNLTREAKDVVAKDVGWHIRRLARQANAAFDEALEPSGLSAAQFTLMTLVAANEDDRIGALAERGAIDPSTLTRTLVSLEKLDLVEIVRIQSDRRRRAVWLTEKGARALEGAMPLWRTAHSKLNPDFADLDLASITSINRDE